MATLSFNSNIASLQAQRRLADGSQALQKSFERLSSGLRINRSADDAAGLAVSTSLNLSARVFTQGVRNANDGISLLNVAEGAGTQLSDVLIRLKELATSAANGSLSLSQRNSLDKEAYELQKEFNRITESTTFNGRSLLNGSFGRLNIQGGFGSSGTLGFDLGASLSTSIGTGSFGNEIFSSIGANDFPAWLDTGDFNGDGKLDMIASYSGINGTAVLIGNGDGTFKAGQSFGYASVNQVRVGDINNDGKLDALTANTILLGNGDGTFRLGGGVVQETFFQLVDINGDSKLDMVGRSSGVLTTRLGNGDGTFTNTTSYTASGDGELGIGDFNGDGKLDIGVGQGNGGSNVYIFQGSGSGSFALSSTISTGSNTTVLRTADFNHDGLDDFYSDVGSIYLSNGNGTFSQGGAATVFYDATAQDINGDGIIDLVGQDNFNLYTQIGNGDGTFKAATSKAFSTISSYSGFGDFNGDGVLDHAIGSQSGSGIWVNLGSTTSTTTIPRLDLMGADSARLALTALEAMSLRVSKELSAIGVSQSRLQSVVNILEQNALNFESARSRIVDADIAQESASLVARQIQQQAAGAVLSQANQSPALALSLLKF